MGPILSAMVIENLQDLLKIGLTDGEAKVYLALLELGSSTAGPIVKKSGVAYSNIYDVLQRLMEKGMASYIVKNKTRYYQAASPSNIYLYLEKKEKELLAQKEALQVLLPKLQKLQEIKPQQEAEIFLGKKGLRTAYEKLFAEARKKDEELFFYIQEPAYAQETDLFYFSIQDILKRVPARGISNKEYKKSAFIQQAKYIQMRYVAFPIPGNMEVCNDKLLLVSWEKPTIGILIHSSPIAANFRRYFNAVWKVAKE